MAPLPSSKAEQIERDTLQPISFIDLKAQQARIRPAIDRAIARVLDHGQYIMGPEIAELERQLAAFTGAKHAISCASGTDALMMAMIAKGIRPGDAVLCPGFTYTATPESLVLLGGTPVFVDVERDTLNISAAGLEAGLVAARKAGLKPVGVIAVDLFGLPADYDAIRAFTDANRLWLLADAAQSFGATYRQRPVGSLAELTITSFFPAKPLGCYGDGGAVFTDDDTLAELLRSIRLHGKGTEKYDVVRHGINGRMDTLQAAVLLEKLTIFPAEIKQRSVVAERYTAALANFAITPTVPADRHSVWAQYTLRVKPEQRSFIQSYLKERGIPTEIYYPRPLNRQPAYASFPIAEGGVPASLELTTEVLSLPMHPYLEPEVQVRIVGEFLKAVR